MSVVAATEVEAGRDKALTITPTHPEVEVVAVVQGKQSLCHCH